jgi:hypothetical protein
LHPEFQIESELETLDSQVNAIRLPSRTPSTCHAISHKEVHVRHLQILP